MLPQVHLVSNIHTEVSGHQSTTNIQPIKVDINGTDSSIVLKVSLTELMYINTPFLSWDRILIIIQNSSVVLIAILINVPFIEKLGNWFALKSYKKPLWNSDIFNKVADKWPAILLKISLFNRFFSSNLLM